MTRLLDILPYLFAAGLITAIVTGTLVATPDYGEAETLDVGLVLPLSGSLAGYGVDIRDGITIAVDEINRDGGIGGKDLRIICRDNQGSANRTAAIVEDFAAEGIPVVIGPVTSTSALAAAKVADERQIVLITPTATTPLLSGAGRYVYRTISSDTYQGRGMATVLMSLHPEVENVAVMYIDNAYGNGLREPFAGTLAALGGTVVCEVPFSEGQDTFTDAIAEVRLSGAEAVALISYLSEAEHIIREARRQDLAVAWIGSDGIVTSELITVAGDATEGIVATIQANQVRSSSFIAKYGSLTGKDTVNWEAAYAYDTMMIVAEAIEYGGYSADGIRSHLDRIRYVGICGPKVF
ncbi:MAG TPA: amino acid ABC transporter substrate-binding protein [Methanoculleus sp.]|nr:amino acid ABC transporter substrate-binding protein [Methanoculleus sp.]